MLILRNKTVPLVSVILSVYKTCTHHLHSAIESVINQDYSNIEFIIIDDGTNAANRRIIRQFQNRDNRIAVIKNYRNIGLTRSLNVGLQSANGKYLSRIDADDLWQREKLSKQIAYLEKNRDCYIVGTMYNEIDNKGNIIFHLQRVPFVQSDDAIRNAIFKCNPFFHSSVVFRREILDSVGYYNESFIFAQDYELWMRIISKYKGYNIPEVLASRRITEKMISIKNEKWQRYYAIKCKIKARKLLKISFPMYKYILNDVAIIVLPRYLKKFVGKKN